MYTCGEFCCQIEEMLLNSKVRKCLAKVECVICILPVPQYFEINARKNDGEDRCVVLVSLIS